MKINWTDMLEDMKASGFWLAIVAFGILYASSYSLLAEGPWQTAQDGHGPFILLVALGIALTKFNDVKDFTESSPSPIFGWGFLCLGLFFYIIGHSQEILLFDVGSIIPVLVGIVLILKGREGLRQFWLPIFFLSFAIPLPGWIMDSLTQPMKLYLSDLVVDQLFDFGLPVAQNGIVIYIAQYQLLVKDACVGLNSLYSLSAVGVFYIYLVHPQSKLRIISLILSILPIAFIANVVRVTLLVLITYYYGETAGSGFLHDFTGLVMFCSALLLFILFDTILFWSLYWVNGLRRAI